MDFFNKLGSLINERWKEQNYNEADFPRIAAAALSQLPPSERTSFDEIVRWGVLADGMPPQADIEATFGQPPLTVFSGRGFRIEVLFWVTGVPRIHHHSFSGVFHVLDGSSLHTSWQFEISDKINSKLLFGKLHFRDAELLKAGDTRIIEAGASFIHGTFHLDCPTVSVVIRTINEPDMLPQYGYLPPSIAYAEQEIPPIVRRRTQLLLMLLQSGQEKRFMQLVAEIVATADIASTFHYVYECYPFMLEANRRAELLREVKRRSAPLFNALGPTLYSSGRRRTIVRLRSSVKESAHLQFFLALLLNLPNRQSICSAISMRYPGADPIDLLIKWISELSTVAQMPELSLAPGAGAELRSILTNTLSRRQNSGSVQAQALPDVSHALRKLPLLDPLFVEAAGR